MFIRRHWWAILYGLLLTAFTVYLALDTFVIPRVYAVVPETEAVSGEEAAEERDEAQGESGVTVSENAYQDENISIAITQYRVYETEVYVADVQLSSAEYLKTAFAQNAYGRNITQKTSEIAENVGAILAVNGDYYGSRQEGYVLRNGVLYRNTAAPGQEDLVIYGP